MLSSNLMLRTTLTLMPRALLAFGILLLVAIALAVGAATAEARNVPCREELVVSPVSCGNGPKSEVPIPATPALVGAGLVGLIFSRRRGKRHI